MQEALPVDLSVCLPVWARSRRLHQIQHTVTSVRIRVHLNKLLEEKQSGMLLGRVTL